MWYKYFSYMIFFAVILLFQIKIKHFCLLPKKAPTFSIVNFDIVYKWRRNRTPVIFYNFHYSKRHGCHLSSRLCRTPNLNKWKTRNAFMFSHFCWWLFSYRLLQFLSFLFFCFYILFMFFNLLKPLANVDYFQSKNFIRFVSMAFSMIAVFMFCILFSKR